MKFDNLKFFPSLLFSVLLLSLGACTDGDTSSDDNSGSKSDHIVPDTPQDIVAIDISPVQEKQTIGAGYDICAPYLSPKAIKAPIVDLQKLDKLGKDYYMLSHATISYSDVDTYMSTDKMPTDVQANISTDPWFTNYFAHSSCFSFTHIRTNYRFHIHRLNLLYLLNGHPERVLSDEFLSDVKTLTPRDIISKYGTHLITSASTGMRIGGLYRTAAFPPAETTADHAPSAEMICESAAIKAMEKAQIPMNIHVPDYDPEGKMHSDGALRVTLEGGNTALLSANPSQGELIAWLQDCTPENGALLGFPDEPTPIYEIIPDKDKAAAVKRTFDQYLKANQLNSLKTTTLLQSWKDGQHIYSTSSSSQTEAAVCAIPVAKANGLQALFSITQKGKSRLVISADGAPVQGTALMLGFVYTSHVDGTIPLYEYHCGANYYYSINENISSDSAHRWTKTGIIGYVIPLGVK